MPDRLRQYIPSLSQNRFVANIGWLGASEFAVRFSRLIAAIVLARMLEPVTFGIAALVLTINELIRVLNQNGIGAKIIQCDDSELTEVCNTAYRLNFIFCGTLFVLQCLLAYPLADFYQTPEIIPMLQVLALVYLVMPFALVQAGLVQRQQRMKTRAMIDGGQVIVDNILTTLFALFGLGAWAIVLPKFLTSAIWVAGYRYAVYWRPQAGIFQFGKWQEVFNFGRYYLMIEVLKTVRLNLDNIIVGRLLGVEALGLYFFAKNAGLGFSLSLIQAVNTALFPNLCELANKLDELRDRFKRNIKIILYMVVPLMLLQAMLAPWYVPIVFGDKWHAAIPILMLLCFSAVPRPFAEAASLLLISRGRIKQDLRWNMALTLLFIVSVFVAAQFNIYVVAASVMLLYLITNPVFAMYVYKRTFAKLAQADLSDNEQKVMYGSR